MMSYLQMPYTCRIKMNINYSLVPFPVTSNWTVIHRGYYRFGVAPLLFTGVNAGSVANREKEDTVASQGPGRKIDVIMIVSPIVCLILALVFTR